MLEFGGSDDYGHDKGGANAQIFVEKIMVVNCDYCSAGDSAGTILIMVVRQK